MRSVVPRAGMPDALSELPEMALGEPVPALSGMGISGWWGCFEVADSEWRRTCFAVFAPDEGGLVRPDVAERCWSTLALAGTNETAASPDPVEYEGFLLLGRDHGYRAWEMLASDGLPTLVLRLLVRVTA